MYTLTTLKTINGISATVTQSSEYELPWVIEKSSRPKDYYEKISTVITYTEDDRKIEITIPIVEKGKNRERVIKVKIDGKEPTFDSASLNILDMGKTFDIPDIENLMHITDNYSVPSVTKRTLRARLPFFYSKDAGTFVAGDRRRHDDLRLFESNGDIQKIISPYLDAMKSCNGKKRELYFPVVTYGDPHHWVICILTIDEVNKPALTFFQTSNFTISNQQNYELYKHLFLSSLIPGINKALAENKFEKIKIDNVFFDLSNQFSEEGCGIAASLIIQDFMNGTKENHDTPCTDFDSISRKEYTRLSIEEDAVRRAQLALNLNIRTSDEYVSQAPLGYKYRLTTVLRELSTHKHTLIIKAEEAFADEKKPQVSLAFTI